MTSIYEDNTLEFDSFADTILLHDPPDDDGVETEGEEEPLQSPALSSEPPLLLLRLDFSPPSSAALFKLPPVLPLPHKPFFAIGSHSDNDLVLPHPFVTSRHCVLHIDSSSARPAARIMDIASARGTSVMEHGVALRLSPLLYHPLPIDAAVLLPCDLRISLTMPALPSTADPDPEKEPLIQHELVLDDDKSLGLLLDDEKSNAPVLLDDTSLLLTPSTQPVSSTLPSPSKTPKTVRFALEPSLSPIRPASSDHSPSSPLPGLSLSPSHTLTSSDPPETRSPPIALPLSPPPGLPPSPLDSPLPRSESSLSIPASLPSLDSIHNLPPLAETPLEPTPVEPTSSTSSSVVSPPDDEAPLPLPKKLNRRNTKTSTHPTEDSSHPPAPPVPSSTVPSTAPPSAPPTRGKRQPQPIDSSPQEPSTSMPSRSSRGRKPASTTETKDHQDDHQEKDDEKANDDEKARDNQKTESKPSTRRGASSKRAVHPDEPPAEPASKRGRRNQSSSQKQMCIAFSGIDASSYDDAIAKLGGAATDAIDEGTDVLVTTAAKRTLKLLLSMSRGISIVSPAWIDESAAANRWLEPQDYYLEDEENESAFEFSMRASLERAKLHPQSLFAGKSFFVAPGTHIPEEDLQRIIISAGGTILSKAQRGHTAVLPNDFKPAQRNSLTKSGMTPIPIEQILLSILRQTITF